MKLYSIFFLTLVLLVTACKKGELKKPTEVNFTLGIDKNGNESGDLKLKSGEINLGDFNVSGHRLEGSDIAFTRLFNNGLSSDLNGSNEIKELKYDIPQGEYVKLQIDLSILDKGQDPSLVINGTYKPSNGPTRALVFEYYGTKELSILGEDAKGSDYIVMDKNLGKKVDVLFDPDYWFETVSTVQLDNAIVTPLQGQDKIIINPTNNVEIYSIVEARISLSNTAIFK